MPQDIQEVDEQRSMLYTRFIEGTRQAVRDVGVDRHLTLQKFMYEVISRSGRRDPLDPPDPGPDRSVRSPMGSGGASGACAWAV